MIMRISNLAAVEFGDELKKDQRIILKYLLKSLNGLGLSGSFSSEFTMGSVNEASDPITFVALSTLSIVTEIFLKAEHQSQVETRLAWTAMRLAPKPLTTGWYKAINLNLSTTSESTAP